jgi:hypothetical protein
MPDGAVAVGERKAALDQLSIDLIEEAELDRIGGVSPDSEVAAALSESSPKGSGISRMHDAHSAL